MKSSSKNPVSSSLFTFPITNISNHVSVKLDSGNYLLWRDQFTPVLICNDLMGYVDGLISLPPKTILDKEKQISVPNPTFIEWLKTDQFLLSCLKGTLSPSASTQVLGLQTSQRVWETVETLFHQQSQAKLDLLRDELQGLQKGSQSIEDYPARIKAISDNLAAINHLISDSELVTRTLNGLPNTTEYQPFVFAIKNRENPILFDELRARLLIHEQRVQRMHAQSIPPVAPAGAQISDTALIARQGRDFWRDQHRDSHRDQRRDQRHDNRGFNTQFGNTVDYVYDSSHSRCGRDQLGCQICKKPGHTVDRCCFRYVKNNQTRDDRASIAQSFAGLHLSSNTSAASVVDVVEPHWLADSGARNHMTSNPHLIRQPSPYTGNDNVYVGNGHSHGEDSLGGTS